ncbi:hypothetical protein TREMEDRAFT_74612 [Tremella mesenterica DSM 1558]|uniref:uncharacterized protein n=1 Tax=Tremella mesenterica (strain ATCC 24925 / CBS 8224 / DSM 1558 / NBRC 9311 / NRRL Y-6157 / RJB 2259-6 / UBC 559-6) TaxID=578456 RepID=UPI0003F49E52|nr:uncharacterized protein TREMEDRAFT_74612 [Tremella mesenterica DSM 1558]EIW66918.1 hypothetical protein TREMEDRAFT_74612 [Tremella mesenterica DSM 1558]
MASLAPSDQHVWKNVMAAKNSSMTQAQIEASLPRLGKKHVISSIITLLRLQLLTEEQKDGTSIYHASSPDDAKKKTILTDQQKVVLNVIKSAGNRGISQVTIRNQIGREAMPVVTLRKTLDQLEKDGHVKTFKGISAPTLALYILPHLTPPEDIAGGVWFDQTKDYDAELVRVICELLFKRVESLTFPNPSNRSEEQRALVPDPINPTSRLGNLPSPHALLAYVQKSRVTTAELQVKHVMECMRALELDGLVEVVKPLSGVQPPSDDEEDQDDVERPEARKSRAASDEEEDEGAAAKRRAKDREKQKEMLKSLKKKERKKKVDEKQQRKRKRRKEKEKKKKRRRKEDSDSDESSSESGNSDKSSVNSDSGSEPLREIDEVETSRRKKSKKSKSSRRSRSKSKRRHQSKSSKSKRKRRYSSSESEDSESDSDSDSDPSSSDVSSVDSDELDDYNFKKRSRNNHAMNTGAIEAAALRAGTLRDLSDTAVVYRATKRLTVPLGQTQVPCGNCPQFALCEDDGPVNARECEYYDDWLLDRKGGWEKGYIGNVLINGHELGDEEEKIVEIENGEEEEDILLKIAEQDN